VADDRLRRARRVDGLGDCIPSASTTGEVERPPGVLATFRARRKGGTVNDLYAGRPAKGRRAVARPEEDEHRPLRRILADRLAAEEGGFFSPAVRRLGGAR
jgi:hypothetical protein